MAEELQAGEAAGDRRLRSWKEIARRLAVDERTVKRWESTRGLPICRVPGEARAPVFAYESEIAAWLTSRPGPEGVAAPVVAAPAARWPPFARHPRTTVFGVLGAILLIVVALFAWQGWRKAAAREAEVGDRTADVRRMASTEIAELSDRLERQPGTVRLRIALAREAAVTLGRVASGRDAPSDLREAAAEAYRRLAQVQNATDRPSLRDRPAARATLATALRLVADDATREGRWLRARILIDSARQAAGDGAVASAPPLLTAAAGLVDGAPVALIEDLALARSEVAQWGGDYAAAATLAAGVAGAAGSDTSDAALRRLRGTDLTAEARFYAGDKDAAIVGYGQAVVTATAGTKRWRDEPRWHWALLRQQWNLGSSLVDVGRARDALPPLAASRGGWLALAAADPDDETVASWVMTTRLSYGAALGLAGQPAAAVAELRMSVAERRAWLAAKPGSTERLRALIVGLSQLGDELGAAAKVGEACASYAEANAIVRRMAGDGQLTALDRGSIVKLLADGMGRHCTASLTPTVQPL